MSIPNPTPDNPSRRSCLVAVASVLGVYVLLWQMFSVGDSGGIKTDPIEDRPWLWSKLRAAEREAEANLAERKREFGPTGTRLGWCHAVWAEKKRILREKYGIEWRTPAEMNPRVAFD